MEQTGRRQSKVAGRRLLPFARQLKATESGQTLIEFALMAPFMLLLMLGVAEIGRAAFITITVNNAATAAAEYGSQNYADASDVIGMQQTALCDANGTGKTGLCTTGILTQGNVVPTNGCACDTGTGVSCNGTLASCTNFSCSGQVVECVQVTTHADFPPLFHYPGLPASYQANGKAIMRVRK